MSNKFLLYWTLSLVVVTAIATFITHDVVWGMVVGGFYTLLSVYYVGRKEPTQVERKKNEFNNTTTRL